MLGFILTIVIVYVFYYIWIVSNYDKRGNKKEKRKKKKTKKMPVEVEYFVIKYKVDLEKINYRYFLQLIGLVVAFDIAITVTILSFFETIWLQFVLGFILILTISLLSFYILGKF